MLPDALSLLGKAWLGTLGREHGAGWGAPRVMKRIMEVHFGLCVHVSDSRHVARKRYSRQWQTRRFAATLRKPSLRHRLHAAAPRLKLSADVDRPEGAVQHVGVTVEDMEVSK